VTGSPTTAFGNLRSSEVPGGDQDDAMDGRGQWNDPRSEEAREEGEDEEEDEQEDDDEQDEYGKGDDGDNGDSDDQEDGDGMEV
ncbi:hypothetical protein ACEN88_35900, partial [Massilia sp. CT11-108]